MLIIKASFRFVVVSRNMQFAVAFRVNGKVGMEYRRIRVALGKFRAVLNQAHINCDNVIEASYNMGFTVMEDVIAA